MKLEAISSGGAKIIKECNDPKKIEVMKARGWKEVGASKPTPKPKSVSKKSKSKAKTRKWKDGKEVTSSK